MCLWETVKRAGDRAALRLSVSPADSCPVKSVMMFTASMYWSIVRQTVNMDKAIHRIRPHPEAAGNKFRQLFPLRRSFSPLCRGVRCRRPRSVSAKSFPPSEFPNSCDIYTRFRLHSLLYQREHDASCPSSGANFPCHALQGISCPSGYIMPFRVQIVTHTLWVHFTESISQTRSGLATAGTE